MDDDPHLTLGPHDLHVRIGDQHYYVRAARRGDAFSGDGGSGGGGGGVDELVIILVGFVVLVVLSALFSHAFERWQQRQPWKVVVSRATGDKYGPTGRLRTVHRETVVSTETPFARMAELADDVRAGRFAGEVARRSWPRRRA